MASVHAETVPLILTTDKHIKLKQAESAGALSPVRQDDLNIMQNPVGLRDKKRTEHIW